MPSPNDQILTLGRRLEQAGLAQFTKTTPAGAPALYRMHRVQILRRESDEVDTGGSCILFFTPEAPGLSGLMIECATILAGMPEGAARAEGYSKRIPKQLANYRNKPAGTWEMAAAKDVVSLALKVAAEPVNPSSIRKLRGLFGEIADHFIEAEPGVFRMDQEGINEINREMQSRWKLRGRHAGREPVGKKPRPHDGQWHAIGGIDGVIAGRAWIPLLKAGERVTESKARAVLRAATREGFSSEIAALVLKYHA